MKHLLRIFIVLLIMAATIIGVVYIKQNFISSHTTEAEHTVIMGKSYCFRKLFRSKVASKGTHSKAGACQIHSVRTIKNGHDQSLHVA